MELVEIFKELVVIPSPSMEEEKVAQKIIEILSNAGIEAKFDNYGNIYAKIEQQNTKAKGLLLSAHMDVVGDDTPVNIIENNGPCGHIIETDKTRTLGADDKAGAAAIIKALLDIKNGTISPNYTIEAIFTRDEENSMTGIEHVEFNNLNSEYVLVLDSDKLGNFEISGAGYLKFTVSVNTSYGGHSGLDIADEKRLNAAKIITEIIEKIPQGVYKKDETGTITSINLGSIIGGGVENALYQAVKKNLKGKEAVEFTAKNSMSNIINTTAFAHYSLRSSDNKIKDELIAKIQNIIEEFNKKYKGLAEANIEIEEHLPVFEKSEDETLIKTAKLAAAKAGVSLKISSFHAGAETHIYANRKNKSNIAFKPVLMGIADVYNMHSSTEKIDIESYKKGYGFLKTFLEEYNR